MTRLKIVNGSNISDVYPKSEKNLKFMILNIPGKFSDRTAAIELDAAKKIISDNNNDYSQFMPLFADILWNDKLPDVINKLNKLPGMKLHINYCTLLHSKYTNPKGYDNRARSNSKCNILGR